ncbi:MAG: ABC transporter permease [Dehalococcoidales bacterium]|nr:ABC transporter permease [Dehalococcoidales bacterium]
MISFIIRRLIQTISVIIILTFVTFMLLHLMPGDPAAIMLGTDASPEQIQALRKELWLDRPFIVQYGHWLNNVIHGDLGISIAYDDPVIELFATRLPITAYLAFWALILSAVLGIVTGIICAIRRGSLLDQLVSIMANIGIAIPVFWLGILGIYFFSLKLGWLPTQGWTSPTEDFWKSSQQSLMPVILLAIPCIAILARQTRSSMLETIQQDYIRTAVSKGLRERIIVLRHALKPALIPVLTLLGLQIRQLVGGSVLVEVVYNIPGIGRLLVTSAFNKDFLVVQGDVLILGVIVCLSNLLVDISYGWIDPRIKYE